MCPPLSRRLLLAAGLLAAGSRANAQEADMEDRLSAILADAITRGQVVGAVFVVLRDGAELHGDLAGSADRERDIIMRRETVFRLGQMTQPIVAAATLALVDAGRLSLDATVTRYLPTFHPRLADGSLPPITVRHLLTHTAGLSYGYLQPTGNAYQRAKISDGFDQPALPLDENLARLATVPLLSAPGTASVSSLGYDVLGAVVQRAADRPLPDIVARNVTDPLGMSSTGFAATDRARLAKPYTNAGGGSRMVASPDALPVGPGLLRLDPRRAVASAAYPSGGAGMLGTVDDYARFLEVARTGRGLIARAETARLLASACLWPAAGLPAGSRTGGGVWGTRFWVDAGAGLTVVLLTNTTPEGVDGRLVVRLRRAIWSSGGTGPPGEQVPG